MEEKKNLQELIEDLNSHLHDTNNRLKGQLNEINDVARVIVREHNKVEKDSRFLVSGKLHSVQPSYLNAFTEYLYTRDDIGYYTYGFFDSGISESDEKNNIQIYETDIYTAYCVLTAQTKNLNFYMNQDTKGTVSSQLTKYNNYANVLRGMIKKLDKQ